MGAQAKGEIQVIKDKIKNAKKLLEKKSLALLKLKIDYWWTKSKIQEIKLEAKALITRTGSNRFIRQLIDLKNHFEAQDKCKWFFPRPNFITNPRMTVKEIVGEGLIIQGGHTDEEIDTK